jgi:DNA polymerase bacteriophage-type
MRCWVTTADFETRSELNLKKVGAWRYSTHPSTEVLCLGYALDHGPVKIWRPGMPRPADLIRAIERGAIFEAHNAFFEWCIWLNVLVKRHGWPMLNMKKIVCTAARAAMACLPRALDNALIVSGLDHRKLDDKAMKKLSKPRKPTKNDDRVWHDEPHLFEQLYEYCSGDVVGERALSDILPALSPFERRVFLADFNINLRGLRIDVEFVKAAIKVAGLIERELSAELTDITRGAVMAATERDRLINFLESTGLVLGSIDQETVEDLLYHEELTKTQRRVLELRQEGARSSVSKYKAFMEFLDEETVRGLYMYYGANAHGRWSGKGPQPQNLPRGDAKSIDKEAKGNVPIEQMVAAIKKAAKTKDTALLRKLFEIEELEIPGDPKSKRRMVPAPPAEVLSTAIRGAFIAREGKTFGVGDYAAIEARVLFWLAEERYGLKIYRANGDLYRDMGSVIFNKPPEALDVSFERMMGKTVVLGCGYAMGWKKFKLTCKRNYGIVISNELAKKCVYAYRNRYKQVPKFWKELEEAAVDCVRTGMPTSASKGRIWFSMRKGHLVIRLPSGREIFHRHAKIRHDQIQFINGKGWPETTYGGKLCEYIVSGTARDLLADAIVKAEFECDEIDPVMHSHDELVCEGEPGKVGKLVEKIMLDQPSWSAGLPIKVEAWEGPRYHK